MEWQNLYTYAFLNSPSITLDLPHGNASQVVLIHGNELSAIVEPGISLESCQNNDQQIIEMVLSHDRVICELFRQITVLPLRFGTSFTSQETLLNHIESHAEEYQKKLNELHGKNEYVLKLTRRALEENAKPSGKAGREYFLAKKQQYETQKNYMVAQNDEKSSLIDLIKSIFDSSIIVDDEAEEVKIYLLVHYQDKPLLLEQFLTWQTACKLWNLFLGEPLPPYHFI